MALSSQKSKIKKIAREYNKREEKKEAFVIFVIRKSYKLNNSKKTDTSLENP